MAKIFITGSADGLGLADVRLLVSEGHEVVRHARNDQRAADLKAVAPGVANVVIGDLSSAAEIERLFRQNTVGAIRVAQAALADLAERPEVPLRVPIGATAERVIAARDVAPYDRPFVR
jgi:NAD(P)-dependent dehydrogenase (short-subunit alcohol dehydrogenase family)